MGRRPSASRTQSNPSWGGRSRRPTRAPSGAVGRESGPDEPFSVIPLPGEGWNGPAGAVTFREAWTFHRSGGRPGRRGAKWREDPVSSGWAWLGVTKGCRVGYLWYLPLPGIGVFETGCARLPNCTAHSLDKALANCPTAIFHSCWPVRLSPPFPWASPGPARSGDGPSGRASWTCRTRSVGFTAFRLPMWAEWRSRWARSSPSLAGASSCCRARCPAPTWWPCSSAASPCSWSVSGTTRAKSGRARSLRCRS